MNWRVTVSSDFGGRIEPGIGRRMPEADWFCPSVWGNVGVAGNCQVMRTGESAWSGWVGCVATARGESVWAVLSGRVATCSSTKAAAATAAAVGTSQRSR